MHIDRTQEAVQQALELLERIAEAEERQAVVAEKIATALEPEPEQCQNLHGMLARISCKL